MISQSFEAFAKSIKPTDNDSESPISEQSPLLFINASPLAERLIQIEEMCSSISINTKISIENALCQTNYEINKIKNELEKWTKKEISISLEQTMDPIKKKLD